MPKGLQYLGSFQTGTRFESENPLEEVWSRIAQHGSGGFLREVFSAPAGQDKEPFVRYAGVRIRQAVEFRGASRQSTLLTSPLSLYYSFLNLTRACLCLHSDMLSSRGHGLAFQSGNDLLSSKARMIRGTFTDYLDVNGFSWKHDKEISIHEALSRIIEIRFDYTRPYGRESFVIPIDVDAYFNGEVILNVPKNVYDLSKASSVWTSELPSLASCCSLIAGENALKVLYRLPEKDRQAITNFCSLRLERDLIWRDTSRWYLIRQHDLEVVFPRAAYYFIAMFILGSIVRYEPELMLEIVNPDSYSGWLLKRFIQAAERFFPQLMLSWVVGHPLYF